MTNRLQWEVFASAQILVVTSDLPPGASEMKWSPISSTLISGKRDAVLVDTAITVDQNRKLVDWIAESGKNLPSPRSPRGMSRTARFYWVVTNASGDATEGWLRECEKIVNSSQVTASAVIFGRLSADIVLELIACFVCWSQRKLCVLRKLPREVN